MSKDNPTHCFVYKKEYFIMEDYGKEYQTDSDIIKSILCRRLAMYAQMLKYLKERELPPLSTRVLNQIEDSVRQAERTIEEIGNWTIPMTMDKTMASTIGLPSYNDFPVQDYETYAIVEVGRICQTIWEISRFVTFDGKVSTVSFRPPPPPGMCSYGVPFPQPFSGGYPGGFVPPNPSPHYGHPFPNSPYPRR